MYSKLIILLNTIIAIQTQDFLGNFFKTCRINEQTFDNCVLEGLNALRPYYKSGLPEYGILPFDPFHASEVVQTHRGSLFKYKLALMNVTESGWTLSHVAKFKSDFANNFIQYTQFFPAKKLNGYYQINGDFFGNKMSNQGQWNLSLYDFVQTTTISRKPAHARAGRESRNSPLKVKVNIQTCKKLELHIGHLAGGNRLLESMLDWIINNAWQPGFVVLRPLINDLVSTAFTDIFNANFRNFPFDKIFPN